MTRAQDDVTFGFGSVYPKTSEYGDKIIVRQNNTLPDHITLRVEDTRDSMTLAWLSLDEAEALAYRLLYAVKRIKEDTGGDA